MADAFEHDLREALGRACHAQNASVIERGRREILALPRDFVLENIERIAGESLPLDDDDWEYLRLLEVYGQLDRELLARLIDRGLASSNAAIQEEAEIFRARQALAGSDPVIFDYAHEIDSLSDEDHRKFHEHLAHNLTIAILEIASDERLSDQERADRMNRVNEIEHRVSAKLQLQRYERSESSLEEEILHWVRQYPELGGDIGKAVARSYESATKDRR